MFPCEFCDNNCAVRKDAESISFKLLSESCDLAKYLSENGCVRKFQPGELVTCGALCFGEFWPKEERNSALVNLGGAPASPSFLPQAQNSF